MHAYAWSCLACGNSNAAERALCEHCGCPLRCTVREIEHYRENYLQTGQALGEVPGLIRDPTDLTGAQFVIGLLAALLLGVWPFPIGSSPKAASSRASE